MSWLIGIIGIFLGNGLWLCGLVLVGIGVWGVRVNPESVNKMVGLMSMASGGTPQGFALRLKGLVDPVDRTTQFGRRMLVLGVVALVIGCSFVRACV